MESVLIGRGVASHKAVHLLGFSQEEIEKVIALRCARHFQTTRLINDAVPFKLRSLD